MIRESLLVMVALFICLVFYFIGVWRGKTYR